LGIRSLFFFCRPVTVHMRAIRGHLGCLVSVIPTFFNPDLQSGIRFLSAFKIFSCYPNFEMTKISGNKSKSTGKSTFSSFLVLSISIFLVSQLFLFEILVSVLQSSFSQFKCLQDRLRSNVEGIGEWLSILDFPRSSVPQSYF